MTTTSLYPGIAANSYGERAIDIVADAKTITGPALAARLGISVYETGVLKRAVKLGYLLRERSAELGKGNINIYTPGPNMPTAVAGKSMVRALLEHIAAHGPITSLALAAAFKTDAGTVSSRLSTVVHSGCVRMRMVDSKGVTARKLICEYFDANLPHYLENHAQIGGKRERIESAPEAPRQNIVPPRTPPEFRALNMAKLGTMPQREGAWDFRAIPSRYAENKCA